MSDPILTDLSTPSLKRAIKDNLYGYFRLLGRSEITEMEEAPGWLRWRTPIGHAWFNGVVCGRSPIEGDTAFVESTMGYFRAHDTPAITWWLSPGQPAADWTPLLQPHGFRYDDSVPGMALPLDILPNEQRLPAGVEILPVDDRSTLATWIDVFAEGYPIPAEMKPHFLTLLGDMGLDFPARNYLGLLDGLPVATSSLYLGAGVAGVLCVATLPAARRRGLGAAMTLRPLYEARELGYQAGILQSSQMGYPVYRQLGFQHVTAMEHFYWPG